MNLVIVNYSFIILFFHLPLVRRLRRPCGVVEATTNLNPITLLENAHYFLAKQKLASH